jgi:hypothetical protein
LKKKTHPRVVVQKPVSLIVGYHEIQISKHTLVYKFENIGSEIMSGSTEVSFSKVLK